MRIHVLQHLPFEDAAGIGDWIQERGHQVSRTAFFRQDALPGDDDFDWLIVLGGFMNVYEDDRYPWLTGEKACIRRAVDTGKVVIGICLGAQLIAAVLGGIVTQNAHREIGWHAVKLTPEGLASPVFSRLPGEFTAFHWHGDTFSLPPGATCTVSSAACSNQAFEFGGRVFGLQFHLETIRESIDNLVANCAGELTEGPYIQRPDEMVGNPDRLITLHDLLIDFLDGVERTCS